MLWLRSGGGSGRAAAGLLTLGTAQQSPDVASQLLVHLPLLLLQGRAGREASAQAE